MSHGKLLGIATRAGSRAAMVQRDSAEIAMDRGVEDDFRGRPGDRQVTVLSREAWQRACEELGRELPWTTRRANLLIEGIELQQTTGRELQIGTLVLRICGETDPCGRMDEQAAGLTAALTPEWRGGACCRVITGGTVSVGDSVRWVSSPTG